MRAILPLNDARQPVPRIGDLPDPVPGPGVLVAVEAAGLNHADIHQLRGTYPPPPGEVVPFERAPEAYKLLERGGVFGKIILTV